MSDEYEVNVKVESVHDRIQLGEMTTMLRDLQEKYHLRDDDIDKIVEGIAVVADHIRMVTTVRLESYRLGHLHTKEAQS